MKDLGVAEIHLQPLKVEQVRGGCEPVEGLCWISLLSGTCPPMERGSRAGAGSFSKSLEFTVIFFRKVTRHHCLSRKTISSIIPSHLGLSTGTVPMVLQEFHRRNATTRLVKNGKTCGLCPTDLVH